MDACRLRSGDVLAFYGTDPASRIISLVTASLRRPSALRIGPSHVGLCVEHPERGIVLVESTSITARKCLFHERKVSGVQAHYPEERIQDYESAGGRVDVWRLNDYWEFSSVESRWLWEMVRYHFRSKITKYDLRGAMSSGTRILGKVFSFCETDIERLFCSEFIAATLMRMERLPLANATHYNPARLLRTLSRINVYYHAGPVTAKFGVVREDAA